MPDGAALVATLGAPVLVELSFEALEEGERVGGAAGEAGEDGVVVQAAHFLRAALDHHVAQRHLPVAAQGDRRAAAHGENGRAVKGFHGIRGR